MQLETTDHTIITDTEALAAFCGRLAGVPFVTVDTEFMRESTFWSQLCLIQMAGPDEAAIIDPLAEGIDLAPFFRLMAGRSARQRSSSLPYASVVAHQSDLCLAGRARSRPDQTKPRPRPSFLNWPQS